MKPMTSAPIRLLLIEPPPPAGRTFADHLRDAGITVHSAPTADEGLQQTYFESFDIVIAAFELPDRSGPDLCRTLKAEGSRISCPVLLLSATGAPADVLLGQCLAARQRFPGYGVRDEEHVVAIGRLQDAGQLADEHEA